MLRFLLLSSLLLFINICLCERVAYDRHKVIRIVPDTNSSLLFLRQLSEHAGALRLDFWTFPTILGRPVVIHLEPNYFPELRGVLQYNNISYELLINDLQRVTQREYHPGLKAAGLGFDQQYHTYPEITRELQRLRWVYPNNTKLLDIGTTYEYRKIYGLEIFGDKNKTKPVIFMNCGIHAREWISPATCMYIARKLLTENTPNITMLRSNYTWIVVPVLNADGYQFSHTKERLWRKNRSINQGCIGVDLNRNFNHHWGGYGTSTDPCDLVYHGKYPFSEPESYALANYLLSRRKEIVAFLDMHSFGQLFMSPWGHTRTYAPHYRRFQEPLMKKVAVAISAVHGTKFAIGPASRVIYPTTGDSTDWCYQTLGVIHSYSVELRPSFENTMGFIVLPSEIILSGQEILNGLIELGRVLPTLK